MFAKETKTTLHQGKKRKSNKKRKFINSIINKHHYQQKVKSIKSMKSTGFAKILTDRRGPTQRTLFQKGKKVMQSFGREEEP